MSQPIIRVHAIEDHHSYLVQVNGMPVYHTFDPREARLMAERLQRLLADSPRDYDLIQPHELKRLLSLSSSNSPNPSLEASIIADNIRSALRLHARPDGTDDGDGEHGESDVTMAPDPIPLNYVPIEQMQEIYEVFPHTAQNLLYKDTFITGAGNVIIVVKTEKPGKLYAIIKLGRRYFMLKRSIGSSLAIEQTFVTETAIFGIHAIRIDSMFGAKAHMTNYLAIENDEVTPLLSVWGHVQEIDVDRDGTHEIVAHSGTPSISRIYKRIGREIHRSNLNNDADALHVHPEDESPGLFYVYFEEDSEPVIYQVTNHSMQKV